MQQAQDEVSEKQIIIEQLQTEISQAQSNVAALTAANSSLNQSLSSAEEDITAKQALLTSAQNDLAVAEAALAQKTSDISIIQSQLDEKNTSLNAIQRSLDSALDTLKAIKPYLLENPTINDDGKTITINFSEAITLGKDVKSSLTVLVDGVLLETNKFTITGDENLLQLNLTDQVYKNELLKLSYKPAGEFDDSEYLEDSDGNEVSDFELLIDTSTVTATSPDTESPSTPMFPSPSPSTKRIPPPVSVK